MSTPVLAPDPGPSLDRLYGRLPEHYRVADEQLDFPLYRWLAGIMSQFGDVAATVEAINYRPPALGQPDLDTSTLVDPRVAPAAYLPWLAQLVGVPLAPEMDDAARRDAILYASGGWRAGTKTSIATAAQSALTGTKYVQVYDHSITAPGDGGQWDVLLVTRGSETPDASAVLQAVIDKGAKPAGVVLHHRTYSPTWATLEAAYPTWGDWDGRTWQEIEETGLG